jgi:hypothetical protein
MKRDKDIENPGGTRKAERTNKAVKPLLFFANWLFVLFLSKRLIGPPEGNLGFLANNIGTLLVTILLTGFMVYFFSRRTMIALIPLMVALALVMGMS